MRLVELGLLRFGPFTDLSFRFGPGPGGLHVIFGQNEAGKSTALRAIGGLLYGIPASTLDAHLHPMDQLRLRGRIVGPDGEEHVFERRKGRKNTLLDPEGKPVDEALMQRLLGGLSQELFETTFGLDADRLRQGGKALLEGKGDVGQMLFDAAVGGQSVRAVVAELRREADELYSASPNALRPRINAALRAYKEASQRSKQESTDARAWATQKETLDRQVRERDALDAHRRELRLEKERLQRAKAAIPKLERRAAILAELEPLAKAPRLAPGASERRVEAQTKLASARSGAERQRTHIQELREERERHPVAELLLELEEEAIEALAVRMAEQQKADSDRVRREGELEAAEVEALAVLRGLGHERLEEARAFELRVAERARIAKLGRMYGELRAAEAEASARLSELGADARLLAQKGAELPSRQEWLEQEVPSPETLERFERELRELEAAEARAAERAADHRERIARVLRDLDRERRVGGVPSERDLEQSRKQRDGYWNELRAGWKEPIADAFEQALGSSDQLADRLRREAERVAALASLEADRQALEAEGERLAHTAEENAERRRAWEARWRASWPGLRAELLAPSEMRGFIARRKEILRDHARLEEQASRAEESAAAAARKLDERRAALAGWRAEFTGAVSALGLGPDSTPEEAEAVLSRAEDLGRKLDNARGLRRRIEAIERDGRALDADIAAAVARYAPDLGHSPVREAGAELVRRHRRARAARSRREAVDQSLRGAHELLDKNLGELAAAEAELAVLVAEASVASVEELPAAEQASSRALDLERDLRELDKELADLRGGLGEQALIEEVAGLDLDGARVRLAEVEQELEDSEAERDAIRQQIAQTQAGLERFDDSSRAADAAAEAMAHAARVREDVERYARVRLAELVLSRQVERYRDKNQGPLLERVNALFPRLTCGRYRGVRVDVGSSDELVLRCVRADGQPIDVKGLSEGTSDQLYLALRLASIERHAEVGVPLPLVLDDLLVSFDEERSRAALEVLGTLAGKLQILLFTHHAHVVELARSAVGAERLEVHQLVRSELPAAPSDSAGLLTN